MKKIKLLLVVVFASCIGVIVPSYYAKAEVDVQNSETVNEKAFSDLSPNEQDYFRSKGFNEDDQFYSESIIQNSPNSKARAANVLVLTGSTKKVSNTMGRSEYILTSTNSPITKITMRLALGNVQSYSQTVNVYSAYAYGGGMYFTYNGSKGYRGVRLTGQVLNGFGYGTVSCGAGGITIGK